MTKTKRLTVGQATIEFLKNQHVERDGKRNRFFAGCFGIFGHGNVAGLGEALLEQKGLRYYQARNEQAMVHAAAAYAKMKNRLATFACTTSIGPGATNMITAAAGATINRLPVLLLPGDIFAKRCAPPVLQQVEIPSSQDFSANDCFKPISKYWDRINRPEQLASALIEAMRVLTSQAETGAVTLAMPQDVQAEAFDFPAELLGERTWIISRARPDVELLKKAACWIRDSKKPLIIAGGGVIYSEATEMLKALVKKRGIPVAETFAGKGSLPYNMPENLGAVGSTGTPGATEISAGADLIIGIGTRYTDFTTASRSAFQNPRARFVNINVAEFDAFKNAALPLVGDARVILEELDSMLGDYKVDGTYHDRVITLNKSWDKTVSNIYACKGKIPVRQAEVIGAVNDFVEPTDVVLCAAGSLPGDLHKFWRTVDPKGFHLEYGNSCMGYEIAGGLGAKMAEPEREIYVMVGDGSYLMMNHEIVTSIQEGVKLVIIQLNNYGYGSIGALSESVGCQRFGTKYRMRKPGSGNLDGAPVQVDFAANARSLGAHVITAEDIPSFTEALKEAKNQVKTTVICIETDLLAKEGGYAWWEVVVAETSKLESVKKARVVYEKNKKNQRNYLD